MVLVLVSSFVAKQPLYLLNFLELIFNVDFR